MQRDVPVLLSESSTSRSAVLRFREKVHRSSDGLRPRGDPSGTAGADDPTSSECMRSSFVEPSSSATDTCGAAGVVAAPEGVDVVVDAHTYAAGTMQQ